MLTLMSAFSVAQNPIRFQNISVNEGLSMGTITGFQKDHNGFIWIATAEGLHRYDGSIFRVFKHKERESNSLSDSYITSLLSYQGSLYVGNNLGTVDIINEDDYSIKTINLHEADSTFDNSIEQLIEYQGRIIIDTDGGGLWQFDPTYQKLRKMEVRDLKGNEVNQMLVDGNKLLLLTANSIVQTDLNTSERAFIGDNYYFNSLAKYKNNYYLGSSRGLYKINRNFGVLEKIALPPKKRLINRINTLVAKEEILWIGTNGGLLKLDNNKFTLFKSNQLRPFSLINDQVSKLFMDQENILWIGTIAGVSKYAPQLNKFGLLQYFDFEGKNYNSNVYFTYEDRNKDIWLGTFTSGLIKLDKQNSIEKIYPKLSDGPYESKSVRAIHEDSKGNFWIGTRSEGIFLFDRKTGASKLVANVENGKLKSNIIRSIYEDRKGRLWIGTQYGLSVKDSISNTFTHYQADASHRNNSIYQIEEHPKTKELILASFRGGLQFFNTETKEFRVLKNNLQDSLSLSNNNLMSLAWVNDDTLLIGTYGGGMNIYDFKQNTFSSISESDGLINNAVYGILYEGNGSCWLSTNNGIVNYNIYSKKFVNFRPVHYLQSTEYNEGAFFKSSTGFYYFGGVAGLNYFKPNEIKHDTAGSNVILTDVRGNFKNKNRDDLELSFLDSRLEIDFTSLYYANPEGVIYKYRLKGYDNDWIKGGISHTAVYPHLSPGNYTFQVIAEDEFGIWTTSAEDLSVVIKPPFWQRWWFIALVLLVISGLVYALFRYRTREIERTYKLQLVDSELAALRSQMNPHFIFNSLNSIQYFILKKEPKEAYSYLSKFASLMRKILQNSRLKYITVADEVEGLNLYLEMEKMRMDDNLNYSVRTRNIDDINHTNIPTMLIQPFVENSIVHGLLPKQKDRNLEVLISQEKSHLLCSIVDNGIGRVASKIMNEKRSSKHTSTGMALTQKRLKILSEGKGDFDVKIRDIHNEDGSKGTEVKLVVPIIIQTH